MAHLYSNENFPLPVVAELRQFGHDVLTVQEADAANQKIPDEEVLAFAISENRAILTINRRHFLRLHKTVVKHCGIIMCTLDADFKGQARRIHEAMQAEGSLNGKLIRINRPPRP